MIAGLAGRMSIPMGAFGGGMPGMGHPGLAQKAAKQEEAERSTAKTLEHGTLTRITPLKGSRRSPTKKAFNATPANESSEMGKLAIDANDDINSISSPIVVTPTPATPVTTPVTAPTTPGGSATPAVIPITPMTPLVGVTAPTTRGATSATKPASQDKSREEKSYQEEKSKLLATIDSKEQQLQELEQKLKDTVANLKQEQAKSQTLTLTAATLDNKEKQVQ